MMQHIFDTIDSPQESIGSGRAASYQDFYKEMVNKYPTGSRMVEVGVFYGRSFSYLIIEMLNAGKKFDCVAVDACPWDGEPCTGFHRHMDPLKEYYRVMFEKVDSFVAAKNFEDASIDMCFIDANHTYEFVKRDIEAYLPKMKKGGTMAGHDWDDPGVQRAVNEAFPDEMFINKWSIDLKQNIWRVEL